jgi:DNA-binding transcriptional ArsR family regulator
VDEPMLEQVLNANGSAEALVRLMRMLSDPTRLRLLCVLENGERNVSWLCAHLDLPQPTVSHHLSLLRSAELVRNRRAGKQVYYALNPQVVARLSTQPGLIIDASGMSLCIQAARNLEQRQAG